MSTYAFTEINSIVSTRSGECITTPALSEQLNCDSKNKGVYVVQHL